MFQRRVGKRTQYFDFEFTLLKDHHFERAATSLPSTVKGLNLNVCRKLTEKSLVVIADRCPNLEQLDMYWNCRISDFGIRKIALNCPKLTTLNLSGCKWLTDHSIVSIAENCPEIKLLNITRLEKISH